MKGNTKKLLVLALTLSLAVTFIAPVPIARANGEPHGENVEILGETYAALFGMTPTTSEKATGNGSWSTLMNPLYVALDNNKTQFYIYFKGDGENDDINNFLGEFTINDIDQISFKTKHPEAELDAFYLEIYTATEPEHATSWFGYCFKAHTFWVQSTDVGWTTWNTTESDDAKTLKFADATTNRNPSTGTMTLTDVKGQFGDKKVKAISISAPLVSNPNSAQHLDDIYLKLDINGEVKEVRINLESEGPETFWVDDDEVSQTARYVALPNISYTGTLGQIYDELSGFFGSEEMPPANFNGLKNLIESLNAPFDWTIPVPEDENSVITIGIMDFVHDGDTVYVSSGTYKADIEIDKRVNLIGLEDEDGAKPVITTATTSTNWTTIKLNTGASGTKIENLMLEVPKGLTPTNGKYYHNIDIYKDVSDIKIIKCDFNANGFLVPTEGNDGYKWGALAIYVPVYNSQAVITIDNCTFTNGYYVTIGGYAKELTVSNSSISGVKSGINFENGGNLKLINTNIEVVPRIVYGDSYAIRFGVNATSGERSDELHIEKGSFIVNNEDELIPEDGVDFSAIIISKNVAGNLSITGATIIGEVVNLSTATLDASGNYWGTDEGPFNTSFKGEGPITIKNWLHQDEATVDLVSGAEKVPSPGSTGVALNAEVKINFPSNATISVIEEGKLADISIKAANGSELDGVSAKLVDNSAIISHPPFAYGTQYTVNVPEGTFKATLGEHANVQVLAERPSSWSFTTAARPLPPTPPPPPPPEEPTPPGAEEPLPDIVIEEAINQAEETGKVVLSAPEEKDTLALTLDQVAIIEETEKPLVVNIAKVQIELPGAVVSNLAELTGAQVEIKVAELSSTAAEQLHEQATNADQYKLASTIFEITMELVNADGDREDITDLGGKVKVYVPVPSDKQELAAAGLLTVARFNENTETWEEIPSSFDQDTKCMIFETTHFSKYAVLEKVLGTTAPEVVSTDPADNATAVPIDKAIKVTFNEDVVSATNFDKITLADAEGATVAVTTTLTASVLTITPSDALAYSTKYTVTIPAGAVKDTSGNALAEEFSFSFTTMAEPDTTAPEVVSTDPVNNATNVPIDKVIKVTFNENVESATNFDKITLADAEGATVAVTTTLTASVLTVTPSDPLDYSTEYTVIIPAGAVKDAAGNPLKDAYTFSFTTMAEPDTTAPEVESTDPANGAVDVPLDKVIKVTFNEEIVEGDAFADIVLKNAEGKQISTKVEISGSDVTIRPNAQLEYSTKYSVVIPAGAVKDAAGNPLKEEYTFSFTTVSFPTKTFDDIQGHWAQHDIEIMAGLGIAKGVGDNKFNPDASITRAEFVALLVRSMGISVEPVSETSFKDVAPDAWYAAEVEAAHKAGIAIGFEDGTFRPYAKVTREQIAAFIVRAMSWTVEEEEVDSILSKFTDQARISSWARQAVAAAAQRNIVIGRPEGTFDPQGNATRAEALVMLKRVLQMTGVIPPNA